MVRGPVSDSERLGRQRVRTQRPFGDLLRRVQVLLHQHRRNREHVADIVEAVAQVVGGEVLLRTEIHRQQVADGVGVFRPVEPPRSHVAGIALPERTGHKQQQTQHPAEHRYSPKCYYFLAQLAHRWHTVGVMPRTARLFFLLALAVLLAACGSKSQSKRYPMQGEIKALDPAPPKPPPSPPAKSTTGWRP